MIFVETSFQISSLGKKWGESYFSNPKFRITEITRPVLGDEFWVNYGNRLKECVSRKEVCVRIKKKSKKGIQILQVWKGQKEFDEFKRKAMVGGSFEESLKSIGLSMSVSISKVQKSDVQEIVKNELKLGSIIQFCEEEFRTEDMVIGDPFKEQPVKVKSSKDSFFKKKMNAILNTVVKKGEAVDSIIEFEDGEFRIKKIYKTDEQEEVYKEETIEELIEKEEAPLDYNLIKNKMDSISSTFCAAKWLQLTLSLQNGLCHSCHHPRRHKINLEEVRKDYHYFNNTDVIKGCREQMLDGARPLECSYCWRIEDCSEGELSDRVLKSGDSWARDKIDSIKEKKNIDKSIPSYLEVSLGNECNLACSYCTYISSSSIYNDIVKNGNYPTIGNRGKIGEEGDAEAQDFYQYDENPYKGPFFNWLEEIISDLEVFRLTGGEPLINKGLDRIISIIKEKERKNLSFAINSNLSLPSKRFEKFLDQYDEFFPKIKDFDLYTSIDSFGEQACYIRNGLNLNHFLKNVTTFLERTESRLIFMVTYNLLSLPNFHELLEYYLKLKRHYGHNKKGRSRVAFDISYLADPDFLSVRYIPKELVPLVKKHLDIMEENCGVDGFSSYEINKMKRIYQLVKKLDFKRKDEHSLVVQKDFYLFFSEYDKRKKLDFVKTFPELACYYDRCKFLANYAN